MTNPIKIRQYSDVYTSIASSLLFPIHEKLKKHITVSARKKLEKSQWLTPAELKQLQIDAIIRNCFNKTVSALFSDYCVNLAPLSLYSY